jgi:dienelactone hydrolase
MAMKTADIEYQDGDLTCRGFVAYDDTVSGKRPGVLVVHEAFGLGEHAMTKAKKLAELGYVAFAADMFGGRIAPRDFDHAIALITDLLSDPAKLLARAGAALDVLRGMPETDAGKLGAIGFCFGGSTVLTLAGQGVDLAAVVSFHGGLKPVPAPAGAVKAKVLVCTGADDPMIPPEDVVAFEAKMRTAGADWQVISYGNTLHSFTNPEADGSLSPAIMYNAATDQRSWAAMARHFEEAFAG